MHAALANLTMPVFPAAKTAPNLPHDGAAGPGLGSLGRHSLLLPAMLASSSVPRGELIPVPYADARPAVGSIAQSGISDAAGDG